MPCWLGRKIFLGRKTGLFEPQNGYEKRVFRISRRKIDFRKLASTSEPAKNPASIVNES